MNARRIHICGTSGSGKSTLGSRLAGELGCPYVELDALWHRENWTTAGAEEFRSLVTAAIEPDAWVVDGNYSKVRELIWSKVELVLWLDYPLPMVLLRLTRRTFGRAFRREVLWGCNRENLWRHLFVPKESLYWWVLTTYKKRRREFLQFSSDPAYAHIRFIRFQRQAEADAWIAAFTQTEATLA